MGRGLEGGVIPGLMVALSEVPGLDPVGLRVTRDRPMFGTVLGVDADGTVWCSTWSEGGRFGAEGRIFAFSPGTARVYLADSATRDRAARWLAGILRPDVDGGFPACVIPGRSSFGANSRTPTWGLAVSSLQDGPLWRSFDDQPLPNGKRLSQDALFAGLDLLDDTRLPDGSRLVDALALAAVCRAVGDAS